VRRRDVGRRIETRAGGEVKYLVEAAGQFAIALPEAEPRRRHIAGDRHHPVAQVRIDRFREVGRALLQLSLSWARNKT